MTKFSYIFTFNLKTFKNSLYTHESFRMTTWDLSEYVSHVWNKIVFRCYLLRISFSIIVLENIHALIFVDSCMFSNEIDSTALNTAFLSSFVLINFTANKFSIGLWSSEQDGYFIKLVCLKPISFKHAFFFFFLCRNWWSPEVDKKIFWKRFASSWTIAFKKINACQICHLNAIWKSTWTPYSDL